MNPFNLDAEKVTRELLEFNSRLAQGLNTLARIGAVEVGTSAREEVAREEGWSLYHYVPTVEAPCRIPVLVVYALVNRPYMADLQPDRSLIKGMLDAGLDIYLLDWGYPDESDRFRTLDDYINIHMHRCVETICAEHRLTSINLLGICQGGVFSLCYTTLHHDKVRNLVTTVTPVDFHTADDLLSHFVRHVDLDLMVRAFGNIPGEMLNWAFLSLKPFRLMGQKYVDVVDSFGDEEKVRNFLRMEKWIFDSPDQAGSAFLDFVRQFYQENRLVKGSATVGTRTVDLRRITIPILNIFARDDHLVPPDSSRALGACVGTQDYTEMEFPGGHIGVYVSGRARATLPPAIADWIRKRV